MSESVIKICHLSRHFGAAQALKDLSLEVRPGYVYGLVGANGAGKTTLMKHLLGTLRAQTGTVRMFGLDPVSHPVEVLGRIGYLSEERDLPEWMTIDELLSYTAAFYPGWNAAYARELLSTFGLHGSKKIKHLSKGMRAQAGLVAAVAHEPELLLLDEPSTGLDAVVRKDILNALVRAVANDGRTAIFSSHLLDEVELMSDYVLMIHQGELVLEGSVDELRAQHWRIVARWHDRSTRVPTIDGLLAAEQQGHDWTLVGCGDEQKMRLSIETSGGAVAHCRNASLNEIFVARVRRVGNGHHA